ncbi:MAG: hypothetical protein J6Q89_06820 [Clostridia bacterium]|nr:hypothetical protein [Clostridia bacterium]
MDYRDYAKDLLSRKKSLISAYSAIKGELNALEVEKTACKNAISNLPPDYDGRIYDDRLINILADLDDCRFRRSVVERELLKIEKGMNGLNDYQRDLIDGFFVDYTHGITEELMEKWFKERSTLYLDRNRALEVFTRSVYGVVQL